MSDKKVLQLPLWKKIIYAIGQFGWSLASFTVGNTLLYFYLPPTNQNTGKPIFPIFISMPIIISSVGFVSRLFDAITDPLIASWSDRTKSKIGRRMLFLLIGGLPFAILSILVFMPPVNGVSVLNIIWLYITIILFYLFMTMYVTPFFALMSELGHSSKERLQLSTMISITWALGYMLGNQIYLFSGIFEKMGFSPVKAFQTVNIIFAIIGFIAMYLPVIFINENKYVEEHVSQEGTFEALISAFKNKGFLYFTLSDLTYWLSLTFISTGFSYYVVVLMNLPKEMTTTFMTVMFILSFVFYFFIPGIANRIGKKNLLIVGFLIFGFVFLLTIGLGKYPIPNHIQGWIVMFFASLPLAIFGIIPNSIVADIAEADGYEKGNFKAAIFFGARTFMSKLGQSITLLLFPMIATLKIGQIKAIDIDSGAKLTTVGGVRLTAVFAVVFCIIGLLLLLKYDEKKVNKILKEHGEKDNV
ncbi:MAG: MFS transporter [Spirochaetes bacterium]|nr:MFS transporter [Spirochaetota bacterium]